MTTATLPTYEISEGGLLRRIERAVRVSRGTEDDWLRRSAVYLAIGYLPVLIIGVSYWLATGEWRPAMLRLDTHVRALVTIPLLLAAESHLDRRARDASRYLFESQLATGAGLAACRDAALRTIAIRDAPVTDVVLLLLALGSLLSGHEYLGAHSFLAFGELPLLVVFRFLLFRWIWRWALWSLYLSRLARAPLALHATHPDRLGGLGPLLEPARACWLVVAAFGAGLSARVADLMISGQAQLSEFYVLAAFYVVVSLVIVLLPGVAFAPKLIAARSEGLRGYGGFAHRFTQVFEARWFGAPGADGLDVQDISSLCDLGQSYDVVTQMRLFLWSPRLLKAVAQGAILPMVPLALAHIGIDQLFPRLLQGLL